MTPYLKLHNLLTGYRQYQLLQTAYEAGVFHIAGNQPQSAVSICQKVGWAHAMGCRAISALCSLELLHETPDGFSLSELGGHFFGADAPHPMFGTLSFEKRLFDAWSLLGETLKKGERVYASVEKSDAEYTHDLAQYIDAMDEAARIRAEELWNLIPAQADTGRFVELGFGSGAYTLGFLERHTNWTAEIADLNDVVNLFNTRRNDHPCFTRIATSCVNLLGESWDLPACTKANLLLLSNLIHCQGDTETTGIIQRSAQCLAPGGTLIIHDFCRDLGDVGALYDLHMMLNTYNGKSYTVGETRSMMEQAGLTFAGTLTLPSGSCAVLGKKEKPPAAR